jgi:hypothetical protein
VRKHPVVTVTVIAIVLAAIGIGLLALQDDSSNDDATPAPSFFNAAVSTGGGANVPAGTFGAERGPVWKLTADSIAQPPIGFTAGSNQNRGAIFGGWSARDTFGGPLLGVNVDIRYHQSFGSSEFVIERGSTISIGPEGRFTGTYEVTADTTTTLDRRSNGTARIGPVQLTAKPRNLNMDLVIQNL